MKSYEVNFDGLVGPSHNYAGLSDGNLASFSNVNSISNPKAAAQQGLGKMKALVELGLIQGVIAPQARPDIFTLKQLGFTGSVSQILEKAYKQAPALLSACYSASSMWAANAATVSPSSDSFDHKVHFTPANLVNKFHRAIESETTSRLLKAIFNHADHFCHHQPLPQHENFGDEGAANHTRLCKEHGKPGIEIFTFGAANTKQYQGLKIQPGPKRYPARQTLAASQAVARSHGLINDKVIYVQQNPKVIDQGVFHNDVIAVGNQNVLFYHQDAFAEQQGFIDELQKKYHGQLYLIEVSRDEISVGDAVASYLFNTQIITLTDNSMVIIAPSQCYQNKAVKNYLEHLVKLANPIQQVIYFDVNESMKNGGGPACLRLRVVLNENELAATNQACLLDEHLYDKLTTWVDKYYRDRLSFKDFCDPELLTECQSALDELSQLLDLGAVYRFQQD
ncbi:MAG: N-succinylarginine dihydrolase [Thalassotalea sp.]